MYALHYHCVFITKYRKPVLRGEIKGKTSHHLLMDRRKLRAEFWGRPLWSRGYFVCSSGQVTDEVIAQSIKLQGAEPHDDDRFRVSET